MKTRIIDCTGFPFEGIEDAGEIIRSGGLVAFPTETVYGLGANGLDGAAVSDIFRAKGRPNDNPLILHIADKKDVSFLWAAVPENAGILMDTFWPGPLTIIAPKAGCVPDEVTAGLDTVAVRFPSHPVARALIAASGVPIAAPSANLSGKPSPTTAEHVFADMDGRIPLIIDGGPCRFGVESTVVSLAGEMPVILRPGAVTHEMLTAVLGKVEIAASVLSPLKKGEVAASPGMKYKHYSPNAEVIVVKGSAERTAELTRRMYEKAVSEGKHPVIAATEQTKDLYSIEKYFIIGNRDDPGSMCANLFRELRNADAYADLILTEGIEPDNEGLAYMNRLLRAAGFKVVDADHAEEI